MVISSVPLPVLADAEIAEIAEVALGDGGRDACSLPAGLKWPPALSPSGAL